MSKKKQPAPPSLEALVALASRDSDKKSYLVDTHAHLEEFSIEEIERLGMVVDGVIIAGASLKTLPRAIELAHTYPFIYYAIGLHPYHIDEMDALRDMVECGEFSRLCCDIKCVGVGECGLDFYRFEGLDREEIEEIKRLQIDAFTYQIDLALRHDKPLILHVREANAATYSTLASYYEGVVNGHLQPSARPRDAHLRGVFHCYNASPILLDFSREFYYGIGGVVTFKNARALVDVLPKIPKERLLLETDAPYLAPSPLRGLPNTPAYLPYIRDKVEEILHTDGIARLTQKNASCLFNL